MNKIGDARTEFNCQFAIVLKFKNRLKAVRRDNTKSAIYKSRISDFVYNISVSGEYIGNQNKVKEIQLFLGISCGLKQNFNFSLILQGFFSITYLMANIILMRR